MGGRWVGVEVGATSDAYVTSSTMLRKVTLHPIVCILWKVAFSQAWEHRWLRQKDSKFKACQGHRVSIQGLEDTGYSVYPVSLGNLDSKMCWLAWQATWQDLDFCGHHLWRCWQAGSAKEGRPSKNVGGTTLWARVLNWRKRRQLGEHLHP